MITYDESVIARAGGAGVSTLGVGVGVGDTADCPGTGVVRPTEGVVLLKNNFSGEGVSDRRMLADRGLPKTF
jgi:hypothetical protein